MSRVLITLFVAIGVGAVALPLGSVGIGWLLCALAIAGVAIAARSVRGSVPILPLTLPAAVSPAPTATPLASAVPAPTGATPAPALAPAPPAALPTPPAALPTPPAPAPRAAVPAQPPTAADRVWRYAAGASAMLLMAVPAVRASDILAFFCLTAALPLASYALVGGRTWLRLVLAACAFIPGAVLGLRWLAAHGSRPGKAGETDNASETDKAGRTNPLRVLAAVTVSVLLALILIPILRSADAVFATLLDSWIAQLPQLDGRSVGAAVIVAFIGVATAFLAHRGAVATHPSTVGSRFQVAGMEWVIPIVVVDLIFAVFVAVQLRVLFGGHDYVQRVGGPNYAEYAWHGAGQLGFVAALALLLAALFGVLARRESVRQRLLIRTAGGLLCVLTLVIVASAVRRLALYVDAYGLSWLRLLGIASQVWLGLIFVLLLVAGVRLRGSWLPRATAGTAVAVLFALVAIDPEALIARTTLERLHGSYGVDFSYVDGLSADAIDEILALPPEVRECALENLRYDLSRPDRWYEFNLAREHARAALARTPELPCTLPPEGSR